MASPSGARRPALVAAALAGALVGALGLAACSGGDSDQAAPSAAPGIAAPEATSAVRRGGPRPSSQVSTDDPDVASDVEVRVGEILSRLDTATTPEGTVITLGELVLFAFDRAELKAQAAATLSEIAEVLSYYGAAPVAIRGHTDDVGDEAYNDDLSRRRARAVAEALVERHGVDPSRLEVTGIGERQPIAPNRTAGGADDPEGRAQNRRVEVVIEGVSPPPS